jgi:hypothetical protein
MTLNDNEYPDTIYGISVNAVKNTLSEFRDGSWRFFDPNLLRWTQYNADIQVATHEYPLGIVLSNVKFPYQIVERIEVGERVIKEFSSGEERYSKFPGEGRVL